jgi:tripartite-type tricarboxylate transporter receptor subunit TctC
VGTHVILPLAARMEGRKLPFDPIKSFEPVSVMAELQLALFCNADLPVNSVQDLVNYAKTKRLAAATDGIGRFTHFALKMFTSKMGIEVTAVPYRGIGATLSDVLENRVQFLFSGLIGPLEHVQTGKMKLLAVCGRTRVPSLPNTPTMIEAGVPDYEATTWYGAFMPVGTDRAIVNRVNAEIVEILKMPDVLKFYRKQGQSAVSSTPEELRERLVRETAKWEDVAQKSGIKLN